MNTVETLATWIDECTYDQIPTDVIARTKLVLYDSIGAAVGAASPRYDIGERLARFVEAQAAAPHAQVFGMPLRTNAVTAALVNGALSYYLDSESHHPGAIMHAIAVVGPATLAVAERERLSGAEVLTALVIGIDVACRISYALDGPALYDRGFHPTCVAGVFGSMAATAKLRGLSGSALLSAFGHAGAQASGLLAWVTDPIEHARPLNMGLASRNGVYASELAAAGLAGAPDILEGKYPLGGAFSGVWHPERLTGDLGERFMASELYFKLYACCAFIHPGLDALSNILELHDLRAADIGKITLRFPESGVSVIDGNPLRSHCAQYVLALAANRGRVDFRDILESQREDEGIASLERRVEVIGDHDLDKAYPDLYPSVVEVADRRNGEVYVCKVTHPLGSPENPVSAEELDKKFERLTTESLSEKQRAHIRSLVLGLEGLRDVRELCLALASASG